MKKLLALTAAILVSAGLYAQEKVYLWPKMTGPGSEKVKVEVKEEERGGGNVHDRIICGITQPYIEVYKPEGTSNGKGILIIGGGKYERVVYDKEGLHYVKFFTEAGYTCFSLIYRTPNDGHKNRETVSLADAQRAIRVINANAEKFGVQPGKTGVIGSSAGGHVAAMLCNYFDMEVYKQQDQADKAPDGTWTSAKPAFQMLMYPVISMQDGKCHADSRTNLLGPKADQKAKDKYSMELNVRSDCPVTFLGGAINDKSVLPTGNILPYFDALCAAGIRTELHMFPASGHGFGIMGASGTAREWPAMAINWLNTYVK